MSTVAKRRRRVNGKVVESRTYYTWISGKRVNLGVTGKQVAELKAARLIREAEQEREGIIPSKSVREAKTKPVRDHVTDYVGDLEVIGRAEGHTGHVCGRLMRLVRECGWNLCADISSDSFQMWRQGQQGELRPKTLNEYRSAAQAFCDWMVEQGRISFSPLVNLKGVDVRGRKQERRALSDDELCRLVAVSGDSAIHYLMPAHTGLRRGEIERLAWGDLDLGDQPCVRIRAEVAKNRHEESLPLHPELVEVLAEIQSPSLSPGDLVFPLGLPRMRAMRKDFEAAGIAAVDEQGRKADFHSIRKSFNMRLNATGVDFSSRQNLMRHRDHRQTAQTYVDKGLLKGREAIEGLSRLRDSARPEGTGKGTGPTVKTSPPPSTPVHSGNDRGNGKSPANTGISLPVSVGVPNGPKREMVEAGGIEPPSA